MNSIWQVGVLFVIVPIVYTASSTWGIRNVNDTVVIDKRVYYPASRYMVQTLYFDTPESSNNKVITAIYLQDLFQDNTGPVNTLVSGEPGWTYASIQMRTQYNVGLNVSFVVYG
ncbi:uncharacterized protein LOC114803646 isoform X2 [Zeugodacus cucurbitae]|uniref:uncharacterized protein LOC114803646 isoform X2 n=1 Tax=Zeugodacus cucurbitae TaxID=28588 RepID=UPI0023D8F50A|nr:uncharacterized protein LOC114803646 isoform X2 [Zeugodacus cucurbitae]